MKKFIAVGVMVLLTGCLGTEMITGFSPTVKPDGGQAFRFVMHPDAAKTFGSEDKAREELLGQQLGNYRYCKNGYTITSKQIVHERLIYEGICKKE